MLKTSVNLAKEVDKLGELQAQISALCKKEKEIKELLKKQNVEIIEGKLFKATVSRYDHTSLNREEVEKYLTATQLKKCLKTSAVVKVTLTSKTKS